MGNIILALICGFVIGAVVGIIMKDVESIEIPREKEEYRPDFDC